MFEALNTLLKYHLSSEKKSAGGGIQSDSDCMKNTWYNVDAQGVIADQDLGSKR